jgi:hypothetical protein
MKFTKREMPTSNGSNGTMFLKFKDGEAKTGVLRGDIYEFTQVWENGKSQVVEESHPDGKSRFRLNFVTQEDGKFVAKIFEFGLTVYNQLADIAEEYELDKTKIKISRRGTGMDTVWNILPLLKEPIPPKLLKDLEAVPLNILEHKAKTEDAKKFDEFKDNIPF